MGRWDFLGDQKPVALRDKVLELVADELVREVRHWPPQPLEWCDARLQERFAPVLARSSNPELDTLRVACELARLDLLHDYERIDRFWGSPLQRELLPAPLEEETAHFLVRWLVEGALEFQEAVQSRFKR